MTEDPVTSITDGRTTIVVLRIGGTEHMLAPEHAEYLAHALIRVAQQAKDELQCPSPTYPTPLPTQPNLPCTSE